METDEKIKKKEDRSENLKKHFYLDDNNDHFSSKNIKIFDFNENSYNNILYSDISDFNFSNINFNNDIKRTTIMPCMQSNDINQNILKFNRIKIKSIKENDINIWKAMLYNHNAAFSITQLNENKYYNDDKKIFNYNYEKVLNEFDEMDIISKDSIRTRCNESRLIKDYIKNLETLLRFFIKENKIKYKQGLNEIAGAFLLLKYSNVKDNMTFSEIYNLFNGFCHLFAFNYFHDKTIFSIKNSLSLLQLLLKYHAPDLYNTFEKSMIFPEIYGTSWILTVFSYKLNINKLFYLWNKLILENDQLMVHYFMASLLIYKKQAFHNLDEYSLPLAINRLNINTEKDIDIIYNNAIKLRNETPYSFRMFAYKLDLLKHKSSNHKEKYELYQPDTLATIPIFPSEMCFICYKDIIKCPDENHILTRNFNCEHCSMKIKKEINYSLFDLRLNDSIKNGILPYIILFDQNELKDEKILNIIKNKFNDTKNKYHFIFMNSKSGNIIDTNSNFNTAKMKPRRNSYTNNKNKDQIQIKRKISKKEKNESKEEDILKKILLFLIENNYKYISYAYGGFEAIHEEIIKNKNKFYSKIKILNHNEEKCEICKRNKKIPKAKLRLNSEITTNKFSKLFNSIKISNQINNNKKEINSIEQKQNYRTITIDEVNKMISETKHFAGPCSFVLEKTTNKESKDNQGFLIINNKKIYCIKTPIHNNKPMQIIQEIFLMKIKEHKIDSKLCCKIIFLNEKDNKENIIIKFNSKIDSEKFIDSFNKAKIEI